VLCRGGCGCVFFPCHRYPVNGLLASPHRRHSHPSHLRTPPTRLTQLLAESSQLSQPHNLNHHRLVVAAVVGCLCESTQSLSQSPLVHFLIELNKLHLDALLLTTLCASVSESQWLASFIRFGLPAIDRLIVIHQVGDGEVQMLYLLPQRNPCMHPTPAVTRTTTRAQVYVVVVVLHRGTIDSLLSTLCRRFDGSHRFVNTCTE